MNHIHLVLLEFESDYLNEETLDEIDATYQALRSDLSEQIYQVQIYQNCLPGKGCPSIMIKLTLSSALALSVYMDHPLHRQIGEKMNPHVRSRTAFDYREAE